jgi:hypothetical protein
MLARGSTTTSDDAAPEGRTIRHRGERGLWLHGIQKLPAGEEHDTGACDGEHPAAPSGIGLQVKPSALNGAKSDGVSHQPRLEACLDRE